VTKPFEFLLGQTENDRRIEIDENDKPSGGLPGLSVQE
jgi:hypothetical protein